MSSSIKNVGLIVAGVALSQLGYSAPAPKLEAFDYADVHLTSGILQRQQEDARAFYLNLSEDSLLQGFRIRAGLPAPGKPMGGWYDPDGFAAAHPFGQYVSALARYYANTGDVRFKEKADRLVHGFYQTLGLDGYFYASKKAEKEWPCYLYDKNCIGMRDAYTLTGNKEALEVLIRMTDWAIKNMPRRSDEWYTLPENLYNCYAVTKDPRFLTLAKEFDYTVGFYDAFARGENAFRPSLHAYSHINSLCSAARVYESKGDPKYLSALENAFRFLTTTQMYASGGWGPNERFVEPGKGGLAASLKTTGQSFETPCGSYANVNVDRYMLRFTGDAMYGDNMDRVLVNGILAALPPLPDGHSFYFSDYHPGATKTRRADLWTCCSGTYAQITADYPLDIYFHDDSDLFVNLFVPSKLQWSRSGNPITVTQSTDYPKSLSTQIDVSPKKRATFALTVRVPKWATSTNVRINGKPEALVIVVDGKLRISRRWKKGDRVEVAFGAQPRFEAIDAENPHLAALMVGPVMMVALANGDVKLNGDIARPNAWIRRDPEGQDWITTDQKMSFRPFYLIRDERYTTYCQVEK